MMTKKDDISQNSATPDRQDAPTQPATDGTDNSVDTGAQVPRERGGPKGPEPTRFGDWESNGRCTDF